MKQFEIKPRMRYLSIWGVPGWVPLFCAYFLISLLVWLSIDTLFPITRHSVLEVIVGGLVRAVVLAALMVRGFYSGAIISMTDDYIEGPFVGRVKQRILRAEISFIREVPAKQWALQPSGLLISRRRPWPGKFIFIPSAVSGYQQIRQELLQWVAVDGNRT